MLLPFALTLAALGLALLLDLWLGEPPARLHPVVWMGRFLHAASRRYAPTSAAPDPATARRHQGLGAAAWLLGASLVVLLAAALQWLCLQLWWQLQPQHPLLAGLLAAAILAALLKPLFAWRMLADETLAVEQALAHSTPAGRARVQHLVSRPVRHLEAHEVRAATISTLAENFNDSVIAPLCWFAVAGLPGAALYRWANTADACWGYLGPYQGHNWRDFGRFAARADDLLSWLPARLSATLLLLVNWHHRLRRPSWQQLRQEAHKTPSPNSGWPMAAMALTLRIQLHKIGSYQLNPAGRLPLALDTFSALRLCRATVYNLLLGLVLALGLSLFWGYSS